ncbi:hypothetical protein NMY22_g6208 [Coprinellus aureogranulatus]|nr:hypothetical protein NMY22_g6208 [Coprinellus aureogranulatus]
MSFSSIPPVAQTAWRSLSQYLWVRRDNFLQFLLDNRRALAFNKRYVDFFCADLEVSLTLTGIASSIAKWDRTYINFRLVDLFERLHVHCLSDEDLWAAMTSGCFLDTVDYFGPKEQFPRVEWWGQNEAIPTFASVLDEWEEVCLRRMESISLRRGISASVLKEVIKEMEGEQVVMEDILDRIATSARRIGEVTGELNQVLYDSNGFL